MDFMSDRLFDKRPFRILTIVDCFTREALSTAPRTNYRACQVVDELDRLCRLWGKPRNIRVDNGPEFAGRLLDQRAYLNKVELDVSRPGKPCDNAYIEAFNSRLRHKRLNASWFLSMGEARARIGGDGQAIFPDHIPREAGRPTQPDGNLAFVGLLTQHGGAIGRFEHIGHVG